MGLFSRKTRRRKQDIVVLCAFRELTQPEPLRNFDPEYGYAYRWAVRSPPEVGKWAVVEGFDGPSTVIVGAIGLNSYVREFGVNSLKSINRLVPVADLTKARALVERKTAEESAAKLTWLDYCRWVAGLQSSKPTVPLSAEYYVPTLPNESDDVETADWHGSIWWRAYKTAEENQRPAEETERFQDLGRAWYRIRNAQAKAAQMASVTSIADSVDLTQVIRDVEHGKDLGDQPGYFLGEPTSSWLQYVKELAKSGEPGSNQALALIYALITIAEKDAAVDGREPAATFTERAAILHRKRKEYDLEVAVIERWENACPPERRRPGSLQTKLAERLIKARTLADKDAKPSW